MSTRASSGRSSSSVQERFRGLRDDLERTKIGGRSLAWYLQGWRLGGILLVLLILFPQLIGNFGSLTGYLFSPNESLLTSAISIGIYVLLALGLNIVVGYAGLLDLGYVAFYVIGAYTVAVFTNGFLSDSVGNAHAIPKFSFWLLIPVAFVLAALFGVLLGAPTLRLRGDYLAIVTLGFGEIVPIFFKNVPWFFQQNGISATPPPSIGPFDFSNPIDHIAYYYLTLALVVLVILLVQALRDSSLGRAWIAIREDETAASASGVNLVRTKLLAFALGAAIGGVGGALNAGFLQTVSPTDFSFNVSITVLIMIVLGGIGSIPGVIVGAILLRFFDVYLLGLLNDAVHGLPLVADSGSPLHFLAAVNFNTSKYLIYGIVLALMILLRPQGLIPNVRRQRELAGIGAAPEDTASVGLLERQEADIQIPSEGPSVTPTEFVGSGSDSQGREG